MRRLVTIVSCAVVGVAGLGACSSSSKPGTSSASTTTTTIVTGPRSIGHVFVINLENHDYDTTWGPKSPARYLNATLVPKGKLLTQYFATAHLSLPNYIAQISGQAPNAETQSDCQKFVNFNSAGTGKYAQALGNGCVYPPLVKTIGDQLNVAGLTWKSYQEDMGTPCRHPAIGANDTTQIAKPGDMYAVRHNPFMYFHSIIDSPTCADHVVDFDRLATDLASTETTPNLAYITPNLCHDGHDTPCVDGQPGGLVSADRFLAAAVPKILASPAFKANGMLVITLDEATTGVSTACCKTPPSPNVTNPGIGGPGGGRIGTLLISPMVKAATTSATPYNHYSLLCSMEDMFGVSHLGFADTPGLQCFGGDVYDAKS